MKKTLILLLTFGMIFALTACSGRISESVDAETQDIVICLASEPDTMDPTMNIAADSAIMLLHAFEGLVKWVDDGNGNSKLAPGIAESWDVSDDGLIYTFHLRDDAVWSDGEPVTAYDFEYAWRRLVDPLTGAYYSYLANCILNAAEISERKRDPSELAAAALDDKTFEVTLNEPAPYFEEIIALPSFFPVRQDIIEKYGDQWIFNPDTYICNGPYMVSEWVHNLYIIMAPNPHYYDADDMGPDSIKFALMEDSKAILSAFNRGEIDFTLKAPIEEMPALLKSGQLKTAKYAGAYYICFRTELEPFDDPLVREAFSLAIDRNSVANQIVGASGVPAAGFIPYGIDDVGTGPDFRETGGNYYGISAEDYSANCTKARELLSKAGYPDGKDFIIVDYMNASGENLGAVGEALKKMWQNELGVTVNLKNRDSETTNGTGDGEEYSISGVIRFAGYNDPLSFIESFLSDSVNNNAHYSNSEYDELVDTANTSTDRTVRMDAMHDAEDILMHDHAVAPVYFYTMPYMVNEDLKGWYYSPLGYFFFGYSFK